LFVFGCCLLFYVSLSSGRMVPVAAAPMVADCSINTQANLSLSVAQCRSVVCRIITVLLLLRVPLLLQNVYRLFPVGSLARKKMVSRPPSGFGSMSFPQDCLMQYYEYNLIGCLEMYLSYHCNKNLESSSVFWSLAVRSGMFELENFSSVYSPHSNTRTV